MAKKVTKENMTLPLAQLVPYDKNPNKHPDEQVNAIAKSIDKYTQYYPIIVDENCMILCGHGKKAALELKGETMADVVMLKGLSHKDKLKLILEDNKIQQMSYSDYSMIEDIIREIKDVDIIGFSTDYLEAIISNNSPTDNEGVDLHAPIVAKSQEEQIAQIPQEKRDKQQDEIDDIESGFVKPHTITCPHCGKEIVI